MGLHPREPTAPSKTPRAQLEAVITGYCDHRLAAIEERLAALERRTRTMPPSFPSGATGAV